MDFQFNAEEWAGLTLSERVFRCRSWSAEAQSRAETAAPELKQTYQRIAEQWATLDREIELQNHGGQH